MESIILIITNVVTGVIAAVGTGSGSVASGILGYLYFDSLQTNTFLLDNGKFSTSC